jgi:hypothetical protein
MTCVKKTMNGGWRLRTQAQLETADSDPLRPYDLEKLLNLLKLKKGLWN